MQVAVIIWIVMFIFWAMIVSRQVGRYRNSSQSNKAPMNRPNDFNKNHEKSHLEKNSKRSSSSRKKQFKDSGLINNDEYDVRDL